MNTSDSLGKSPIYRAAGNRLALNLDELEMDKTKAEILALLGKKGFSQIDIHLDELARSCIPSSKYKRGSRLKQAPQQFDCSSFTKWLYAQKGISIPRRSIQQSTIGTRAALEDLIGGDLIMTSGYINYFFDDPETSIGHVGIVSNDKTVIHAANAKQHIIESTIEEFVSDGRFRDARRIIPKGADVRTFVVPEEREIETSDDVVWILRQKPRKP